MTDKPTAERILKAFSDISLTIIKHTAGEDILRRLTPLSGLQEDILQRLGLGATLYRQLEIQVTLIGSRALAAYGDVDGPSAANNQQLSGHLAGTVSGVSSGCSNGM